MATWYKKDLGNGVAAFGTTKEIMEVFLKSLLKLAEAGGYSYDLALFSRYDLEEDNVAMYFTPSAEILAQAFGAIPCEKPEPKEGFALIVGDDRSWEIHFPGYREKRRNARKF